MLPSLFASQDGPRAWSLARSAAFGAAIGLAAALFRLFGPLHQARGNAGAAEIAGAALGFALLCAAAAFLRNVLVRRLIWPHAK